MEQARDSTEWTTLNGTSKTAVNAALKNFQRMNFEVLCSSWGSKKEGEDQFIARDKIACAKSCDCHNFIIAFYPKWV